MPVVAEEEAPTTEPQEQVKKKETISKPMVDYICPPPEVRNIVDKTANFVARNGPDFEARIRQNEIKNAKFNFLKPDDPYHAYYQHKVTEIRESDGPPESVVATQQVIVKSLAPDKAQAPVVESTAPKDPPPEFEFVLDPPSISSIDLDVVKLTAQFVARNGRQFLTNLMSKEQRNYQFDFLRPQHSLFSYFTRLVEQYTKILIPHKDMLTRLAKEDQNPTEVLAAVKYRVDWARQMEMKHRKEAEALERERVAYAQIDWHDFVVVEQVDYRPDERGNFPPPTTPAEVGARVLAQERGEQEPPPPPPKAAADGDSGEEEEEEMEMDLSDDEAGSGTEEPAEDGGEDKGDDKSEEAKEKETSAQVKAAEDEDENEEEALMNPPLPPKPPLPPAPDQVIVKDYDPKAPRVQAAPTLPDQYLISPLTQEKIPVDKMQEHMKISLLDPKWREQQARALKEKKEQEGVFATGASIDSHLRNLAARRTDIFGSGAEETSIGKKIGEEEDARPAEKVTWDGHSSSMEKVAKEARRNITVEDQLRVIQEAKGLGPDSADKIGPSASARPPMPRPPMARPPVPPPSAAPPMQRPPPPPPRPVQPPMPTPMQQQGGMGGDSRPPVRPPMPMPNMGPQSQRMVLVPPAGPRPSGVPAPILAMPMAFAAQAAAAVVRGMAPMVRAAMPQPPGPPMGVPRPMVPPPAGVGPPVGPPGPPQGPPGGGRGPGGEPPAKKAKTEDNLVSEAQWLAQHPMPVTVKVAVPNMSGKSEWNLTGQVLAFTLPLTDQVSVIKAKINEVLGMPAGKQKLQYEGMFIKDSNTLAFYNFLTEGVVHLAVKERGGRKK